MAAAIRSVRALPRTAKRQRDQRNAPRRRKKRAWLRTILFYLFFPLIVWLVGFLLWFYWHDLTRLFSKAEEKPKAARSIETKQERQGQADPVGPKSSQEKILDEDRKKLEDILKQRQ